MMYTVWDSFRCIYLALDGPLSNVTTFVYSLTSTSPVMCPSGFCADSPKFMAPILISVRRTGLYDLFTQSTINTYGILYQPTFDIRFLFLNSISADDDSAGEEQFKIQYFLQANQTYVLVVTTYPPFVTGVFTLIGIGPALLNYTILTNLSKSSLHRSDEEVD